MRKVIIMSFFFTALMILNCNKKNVSGPDNSISDLIVQFIGPLHGEACIVLHSLDGKEIKDIQTIRSNEIATFKDIDDPRVTFTAIYKDTSISWLGKTVNFQSFINVPREEYSLTGPMATKSGNANVTLDSPDSTYSSSLVSIPGSWVVSASTTVIDMEVRELDSNGKLTLFASQMNTDNMFGFYGWLEDQGFENNISNQYNMLLNKPLHTKTIQTNLPITNFTLWALMNPYGENTGSQNIKFGQDTYYKRNYDNQYTEFTLFYAPDFPKDCYELVVDYFNQDESYSYSIVANDLPNSITVPADKITGDYNHENGSITEIAVTGNADHIEGVWSVSEFGKFNHTWTVIAAPESQTISRPFIPDSIFTKFDVDFTTNPEVVLRLYDYDNVQGFDDYLLKSSKAREQNMLLYKKMYRYGKQNLNAS